MNSFSFDSVQTVSRRPSLVSERTTLERMITRCSFGLIKSKQQIMYTEIAIVLIFVVICLVAFLKPDQTIQNPTEDLINADQPANPL